MRLRGYLNVILLRKNKIIYHDIIRNSIVTVGKNALLGTAFHNDTQYATWYFGVVDKSGFSEFSTDDTMVSHPGWNEFTNYSSGTRIIWSPDAPSDGAISNSVYATITFSGAGLIYGLFLVSDNTKGGTSGILWSEIALSDSLLVASTDQLKFSYAIEV